MAPVEVDQVLNLVVRMMGDANWANFAANQTPPFSFFVPTRLISAIPLATKDLSCGSLVKELTCGR